MPMDRYVKLNKVAPYTGAWIEIVLRHVVYHFAQVAPYTGAWIEINSTVTVGFFPTRRTLHGCVD